MQTEDFQEAQALYKRVSSSIRAHTFDNTNLFPNKRKDFDYSIGSIDRIIEDQGVDAILLVDALDEISSAGRKALMTAGIVAGALLGIVPIPRGGTQAVSMGMVDRSGAIIWFNTHYGGSDMREPDGAAKTVNTILPDLFGNVQ